MTSSLGLPIPIQYAWYKTNPSNRDSYDRFVLSVFGYIVSHRNIKVSTRYHIAEFVVTNSYSFKYSSDRTYGALVHFPSSILLSLLQEDKQTIDASCVSYFLRNKDWGSNAPDRQEVLRTILEMLPSYWFSSLSETHSHMTKTHLKKVIDSGSLSDQNIIGLFPQDFRCFVENNGKDLW